MGRILSRNAFIPNLLGQRDYVHGTTLFDGCLKALIDNVSPAQPHIDLRRFTIRKQCDRCGEIVLLRGLGEPGDVEGSEIQSEMIVNVDGDPYTIFFLPNGPAVTANEAYDEKISAGFCVDEEDDSMVSSGHAWPDFGSWVRSVVAVKKVHCQALFGAQPYRWIHLADVDLSAVKEMFDSVCTIRYSLECARSGLGGRSFIASKGSIESSNHKLLFDIRFCY